jgi:MtrB/PioB family decaheme-associated outer membrane protein
MRNHTILISLLTLTVAAAAPAAAQTPQTTEPAQAPQAAVAAPKKEVPAAKDASTSANGWIDFGVRGTNLSGDGARFERYRDLGNGLFVDSLNIDHQTNGWFSDLRGAHLGGLDQRLTGHLVRPGKLKIYGQWDQIPMLFSRTTQTMFVTTAPGVLRIPDLIQSTVQATPSQITTMVQQFDRPFTLQLRRHVAEGGFEYMANRDLTIHLNIRNTDKQGAIPYGGSFGHSSFVETPAPVEHNLLDVDAGGEYVRGHALARVGYTASIFHNDITSFIFDNPYRLTDTTSAPSAGRSSLPPSSTFNDVNAMFRYTLPRRTVVMAYVSVGSLKDAGAPIMPNTINSATTGLLPLDRTTVEGAARTKGVNFNFSSKPVAYLAVNVKYKLFDYDNRTPVFNMTQRIAYDNAPSAIAATAPVESEPFGVKRHSFDADVTVTRGALANAGAGFSRIVEDRTFRLFSSTTENTARAVFDAVSTRWFTVRTKFEHSTKRGVLDEEVFNDMTGLPACAPTNPTACAEQPGMRHFDIADRDRNRFTVLGSVTPRSSIGLRASAATGHDNYLNSTFGLLDNKHRIYSAGIDLMPSERVIADFSYSFEKYDALSRSRQANPTVDFFDPARNWSTNGADRVHSVIGSLDFTKIHDKVDLRFSVDYNRARSLYVYGTGPIADRTLPEETDVVASTLPPPTQLPLVKSETLRGTFDLMYSLTDRISVGFSYWYDQYRVTDFTLDAQANPTLDKGNALLLGYIYRPYTANTCWGRILYRW